MNTRNRKGNIDENIKCFSETIKAKKVNTYQTKKLFVIN